MKKTGLFVLSAMLILAVLTACAPKAVKTPTTMPTDESTQYTQDKPDIEKIPAPTNTPKEFLIIPECSQAPIGENTTCKISHAYCSYKPSVKGAPTFCNDAPYPNHNFTLLRWGEDWSKFDGSCLIVSGYVSVYKGKLQIEATEVSQIKYCD